MPSQWFIASTVILMLLMQCTPGKKKNRPIALVDEEIITEHFLDYTIKKMELKSSRETRRKIINNIIENILIARKAETNNLHELADFKKNFRKNDISAKMDFLCDTLEIKEKCDEVLYEMLEDESNFQIPEIDWKKAFIIHRRKLIPIGGKIPKIEKQNMDKAEAEIDEKYTSAIMIHAGIINESLYTYLKKLTEEQLTTLKNSGKGQDKYFNTLLVYSNINYFSQYLDMDGKKLFNEISLRARQNLLVSYYKESIGFSSISGGKASSVRYDVTQEEARIFYNENRDLFKEPVSIKLSHIRVKDFKTADRVRKKIMADPDAFCKIAKEFSIAADADKCGYIGIVNRPRGRALPLYKEFGFTLKNEGQISIAFKTPEGIEVLKLLRRKTRLRPFSDPYTQKLISEKLQPLKRENRLRSEIEKMRKKARIKIIDQ